MLHVCLIFMRKFEKSYFFQYYHFGADNLMRSHNNKERNLDKARKLITLTISRKLAGENRNECGHTNQEFQEGANNLKIFKKLHNKIKNCGAGGVHLMWQ